MKIPQIPRVYSLILRHSAREQVWNLWNLRNLSLCGFLGNEQIPQNSTMVPATDPPNPSKLNLRAHVAAGIE
jgi:hypothetical protein